MKFKRILIIACGALVKEIQTIQKINQLDFKVVYLSADLHNFPEQIPAQIEQKILQYQKNYDELFIAYGDCGTGGQLDQLINRYQIKRLSGAHCYQFFAPNRFKSIKEDDLGTFYLTDFLAKNFQRLVVKGLGILEAPELLEIYFKHYTKLLYLIQNPNHCYRKEAFQAAEMLGLSYHEEVSGYGFLETALTEFSRNR